VQKERVKDGEYGGCAVFVCESRAMKLAEIVLKREEG
jgi:hypothetical protein